MSTNPNNVKNFPIETLTKNRPFFMQLSKDLFYENLSQVRKKDSLK